MTLKMMSAGSRKGRARRRAATWLVAAAAVAAGVTVALVGFTSTTSHAVAQTTPATPACTPGTDVQTADGPVCGVTADGVTSYLGIYYAAPPVRWEPPAPVTPGTTTLQATTEAIPCPAPGAAANASENCLDLDVQVPAGTTPGERLPVMFEIHGGGFIVGAASANGSNLVTNGHVIYVTINYRLGILGFMANKALGPNSGDYGLQDQQAAMRWVQQNIASFGGDPHNVTIFGQSAGGASVCDAIVSPTAAGLFQRGISQSGFYNYLNNTIWATGDCKSQLFTEAQAQQAGAAFANKVGCGTASDVIACLRALPVQTLLNDAGQIQNPTAGGTIAPTLNGTTLVMSPGKAFATGHFNRVGVMIGVDRDEFNGGVYNTSTVASTPAQYRTLVTQQFGPLAPTVMRLYPLSRFPAPSPFIAYRTIMADSASVCPALQAFARIDKYTKEYAWEGDDADTPRPTPPLGPLGSPHVAESAFMFPNPALTLDANQQAMFAQVTQQWTGYARTGNPTVPGTPLWTRYTKANPNVMSLVEAGDSALDPTSTIAMQHQCGFWDAATWPVPRH